MDQLSAPEIISMFQLHGTKEPRLMSFLLPFVQNWMLWKSFVSGSLTPPHHKSKSLKYQTLNSNTKANMNCYFVLLKKKKNIALYEMF